MGVWRVANQEGQEGRGMMLVSILGSSSFHYLAGENSEVNVP
jgi:hypothetical protein